MWSYHGQEEAQNKLKKHLLSSSLHNADMDEARAQLLADLSEFELHTETAEDRRTYRMQVEAAQGTTASTSKQFAVVGKGKGGGSRQAEPIGAATASDRRVPRSPSRAPRRSDHRHRRSHSRRRSRSRGGHAIGHNPAGTGHATAVVPHQKTIALSVDKAKLLVESLTRSAHSMKQAQHLATQAATKATELATAFTSAAAQYNEEVNVLRQTTLTILGQLQESGIGSPAETQLVT